MKPERPKCRVCGGDLFKLRINAWACGDFTCNSPIQEPLMYCDDIRCEPEIVPRKADEETREVPT